MFSFEEIEIDIDFGDNITDRELEEREFIKEFRSLKWGICFGAFFFIRSRFLKFEPSLCCWNLFVF